MTVESRSGLGSYLIETVAIREQLPVLVRELGVRTFLDAPCGDLNWMKQTNLEVEKYIGIDLLTDDNWWSYASLKREFLVGNILYFYLPRVDMIFCRDCLVHLSNASAIKALENFKRSGSKYLVATTYPNVRTNSDLDGDMVGWRKVNLELPPFNLGNPLRIITEAGPRCEPGQDDFGKVLGVWSLQ
jgi:hypothetical protein